MFLNKHGLFLRLHTVEIVHQVIERNIVLMHQYNDALSLGIVHAWKLKHEAYKQEVANQVELQPKNH